MNDQNLVFAFSQQEMISIKEIVELLPTAMSKPIVNALFSKHPVDIQAQIKSLLDKVEELEKENKMLKIKKTSKQ